MGEGSPALGSRTAMRGMCTGLADVVPHVSFLADVATGVIERALADRGRQGHHRLGELVEATAATIGHFY